MSLSDEQLAESAKGGDVDAFAALVARYEGKMYGLAMHLLRNPEDAADAAQETFVRCYGALDLYDHDRSFAAWLYRIAYNYCLDVLRQRRRTPTMLRATEDRDPAENAPDPGAPVEELVERNESIEGVTAALEELPDEYRHILALRYMLDLPYAEIAQVLDVPQSTVTMRLHRAKLALRRQMAGGEEGGHGAP